MNRLTRISFIFVTAAAVLAGCSPPAGEATRQDSTYALAHVNLVPMTSEVVLEDQTLLVSGDRIIDFGPAEAIAVPEGVEVIDGEGAYLLPGLADMHVHIYQESREELPVSPFLLYIAKGVTTIRDCGTAPLTPSDTFVLEWRDEILRGEIDGPMIYSSGRTINGPKAYPGRYVKQRYEDGFDFAKLYLDLTVEEFAAAQQTAEDLDFYTVGHIPYQVGLEKALSQGLDEIAHLEELSFDLVWETERPSQAVGMDDFGDLLTQALSQSLGQEIDASFTFDPAAVEAAYGTYLDRVLELLLFYDIPVGTTLATYDVVDQKLFNREAFLAREINAYLPESLIAEVIQGENKHQVLFQMLGDRQTAWFWKTSLDQYILGKLHQAGVRLVSGTDAGSSSIGVVEGFATQDDLRLLTEFGFTPYEALLTATVNAAAVVEEMTGENDFGTIEIGKRADLILLAENPLEDIRNLESITGVMVRGVWYSAAELAEMIELDP